MQVQRYRIITPLREQVLKPVHDIGMPLWATRVETVVSDVTVVTDRGAELFPIPSRISAPTGRLRSATA